MLEPGSLSNFVIAIPNASIPKCCSSICENRLPLLCILCKSGRNSKFNYVMHYRLNYHGGDFLSNPILCNKLRGRFP